MQNLFLAFKDSWIHEVANNVLIVILLQHSKDIYDYDNDIDMDMDNVNFRSMTLRVIKWQVIFLWNADSNSWQIVELKPWL